MAKVKIYRKDGTPTPYFWSDRDSDRTNLTVYKQTDDGVKRMRGVHYDAIARQMRKEP